MVAFPILMEELIGQLCLKIVILLLVISVGEEIEIELDYCYRESGTGEVYDNENIIRRFGSSTNVITSRGSSSNLVISSSAVNSMNSPNSMEVARRLSEMVDATGKEYEFKIEDPGSKFTYSLICRK